MTMTRREEPSSTFTRTTMPAFSTTSEPASPTTFGLESEPSSLSPATSLEYRCPTSSPKMVQYQAPFYATHSSRMSVSENRPSPNQPHVSFSSSFSCAAYPAPTIQALEPYRRSPPPETRPELRIQGGSHLSDEYVLMVQLPVTMTTGLAPEMITISARKENKLAIVADVWHAENNCESDIRSLCCETVILTNPFISQVTWNGLSASRLLRLTSRPHGLSLGKMER